MAVLIRQKFSYPSSLLTGAQARSDEILRKVSVGAFVRLVSWYENKGICKLKLLG